MCGKHLKFCLVLLTFMNSSRGFLTSEYTKVLGSNQKQKNYIKKNLRYGAGGREETKISFQI
jgi:hypothetical protein